MMVDSIVIKFFSRISHLRLDVNGVPQLQPLFECIAPCLHWVEFFAVLDSGTQLVFDFCLRLAKHIFRDRLSVCGCCLRHWRVVLASYLPPSFSVSTHDYRKHSRIASPIFLQAHFCSSHCSPILGIKICFLNGRKELPNRSFSSYFLHAATEGGRGVCVAQTCADARATCKTAHIGTTRPTQRSRWLRRCAFSDLCSSSAVSPPPAGGIGVRVLPASRILVPKCYACAFLAQQEKPKTQPESHATVSYTA